MRSELADESVRRLTASDEHHAVADPPPGRAANGDDHRAQLRLGLTVELADPGGGSRTLERSDIQALQSTSFQLVATLAISGAYSIRVKNPSGDQSEPFSFVVQSDASGSPPHIDSVNPTTVVHSANTQVLAVAGSNFSSALNVTLVDPSGQPLGVNGAISGSSCRDRSRSAWHSRRPAPTCSTSRTRQARSPIPWPLPFSDLAPFRITQGAATWRHCAFIQQPARRRRPSL